MSHPPALQAVGLRKAYRDRRTKDVVQALDGLSFEAERGTVFGLLGPNGAGKSTTVKILATLCRPDEGSAVVAGVDVGADPNGVRRRIGLVSQQPSSDPMGTGRENLVLAGRIQGLSRAEANERAGWLLQRFGIADAADRLVKTWSGGMSRKLDVAIGLVHKPEVLFLDEPTTGLDPEARAEMWAEIGRLAGDDAMTVLLTTHYLDEADALADRIVIIDRGRIVASDTADNLKTQVNGDLVDLEVAPDQVSTAAEQLRAIAEQVEVTGSHVSGRVRRAGRAVPALLRDLDAAGVTLESVEVHRPTLDDVFLTLTGRSLRDAEAGSGKPEDEENTSHELEGAAR